MEMDYVFSLFDEEKEVKKYNSERGKSMSFNIDSAQPNFTKIKVVGVGGGGGNAVNRMVQYGLEGAEFIVVNTDLQALTLNSTPQKIQIGEKLTKGLGSGGDPTVGEKAAEESREELERAIKGADLVFIAAGLGGGTGTGAAPIVAEVAKSSDALTVAFVTTPFWFEGTPRSKAAQEGYDKLRSSVDSIVKVPNDKLLEMAGKNTPLNESFRLADDALRQGIQGLTEIIVKPSFMNLDFADVKKILKNSGTAHMGIATAKGDNRVIEAVKQAIQSPLLDTSIKGAKGIILNIIVDPGVSLPEIEEASRVLKEAASPDAETMLGVDINDQLEDEVHVTVIATGFDSSYATKYNPQNTRTQYPQQEAVLTKPQAQREDNPIPGRPLIQRSGNDYNNSEPELPTFVKKSPKRIQMDD